MAEEKKNPLFGAFRTTDPPKAANPTTPPPVSFTPVATKATPTAPPTKPDEVKKSDEPSKPTADPKSPPPTKFDDEDELPKNLNIPMEMGATDRITTLPLADILTGEKPKMAVEELSAQTGESTATIKRIRNLVNLTPELQDMVEEKKLPVNTASDIASLKKDEQNKLADAIKREDKVPSGTQAAALKEASKAGTLTTAKIEQTVAPNGALFLCSFLGKGVDSP